jgi:hypothetical protein
MPTTNRCPWLVRRSRVWPTSVQNSASSNVQMKIFFFFLGAESFIDASDGNFSKRYAVTALHEQFAWVKTIGDVNNRRMALEQMVSFLLDSELRAAKRIEHACARSPGSQVHRRKRSQGSPIRLQLDQRGAYGRSFDLIFAQRLRRRHCGGAASVARDTANGRR